MATQKRRAASVERKSQIVVRSAVGQRGNATELRASGSGSSREAYLAKARRFTDSDTERSR